MGEGHRKSLRSVLFEHLGKIGHGEIARSRAACMRTFILAGGGGLITAITVLVKILILGTHLSTLASGILASLNFAGSFLFMQACRFRLATKLSPLLGATLGAKHFLRRDEMMWSFRTQFFSALGNLGIVIPTICMVQFLLMKGNGVPYLDVSHAEEALRSLHPWKSGTILYAAFTGGLLWLSTLWGGGVAGRFWPKSKFATTVCFNVLLGVFLGFIPVYAKVAGLPLDVRHFTLSGGMIGVALVALGMRKALDAGLLAACFGVLFIGFLNFSVSFALAFISARTTRLIPNTA